MLKLNIDGCKKGNNNFIWAGGVLRDYDGKWISRLSIWAHVRFLLMSCWDLIYLGLQLARGLRIHILLVESDSALTIHLVLQAAGDNHHLGPLVLGLACWELLSRSWQCDLRLVLFMKIDLKCLDLDLLLINFVWALTFNPILSKKKKRKKVVSLTHPSQIQGLKQ